MSEYQAVYDAIRSRFHGDFMGAFERALYDQIDFGHARMMLQEQIAAVGYEHTRPSAVYRPRLLLDGSMWCALYGDDLMDGVAGFGDTPEKAMQAFDKAWHEARTPSAVRKKIEEEEKREEALNNGQFGVGA